MILSNLFKSIATKEKLPDFLTNYIAIYPILEDYEREKISDEEYRRIEERFKKLASNRIKEFAEIEPKKIDEVIFVVKQKDTSFASQETYLHSFLCKISEIKEKAYLDFCIWNDERPRIEHYAYDFSPLDEVMGCEVVFDVTFTEAISAIFHELTFNGLTQETFEARKEEIIMSLKKAEEDIRESNTYTMEEVFQELEKEILENATEQEREKFLKEKEEKEKNRFRDDVYSNVVSYLNHYSCINLIRSWYLQNIENGKIKITEKLV